MEVDKIITNHFYRHTLLAMIFKEICFLTCTILPLCSVSECIDVAISRMTKSNNISTANECSVHFIEAHKCER